MAPVGTRFQNCFSGRFSQVRRSAGLSVPGRDTYYKSCSVFICALRSLYSALNVIPLHWNNYGTLHWNIMQPLPCCSQWPGSHRGQHVEEAASRLAAHCSRLRCDIRWLRHRRWNKAGVLEGEVIATGRVSEQKFVCRQVSTHAELAINVA